MTRHDVGVLRLLWISKYHHGVRAFTTSVHHAAQESSIAHEHAKVDGRNRLSAFWTPTAAITKQDGALSNQDMLVRAGIMRQAHAGIFHLLPLGLRVQEKLEKLIDKHMARLAACKVSLSSITSEKLWQRSGRGRDDEFFHFQDRKGSKYMLSPTHEEEITSLVASAVTSYKDLPLRLYQISRKYRDEARPRQGFLRAREFLMKDLYTFDHSEPAAMKTYDEVRDAYRGIFKDLGMPYVEAAASSGNMGGNLSHEYHLISDQGEDTVISCQNCGFAANEEVFTPARVSAEQQQDSRTTHYMSRNRRTLYQILTPSNATEVNIHLVKRLLPEIDASVEAPLALWRKSLNKQDEESLAADPASLSGQHNVVNLIDPRCQTPGEMHASRRAEHILTKPESGNLCPQCDQPALKIGQATEVGHTFHLGTRYSEPFDATVNDKAGNRVTVQMGCHGIGVSRLIAATSGLLADAKGLNWPLAIAPFSIMITAVPSLNLDAHMEKVYDEIMQQQRQLDLVIDDRQKSLGYKLNDADVVGYPLIVVLGRNLLSKNLVELQCRRLGFKEEVALNDLGATIQRCTARLEAL